MKKIILAFLLPFILVTSVVAATQKNPSSVTVNLVGPQPACPYHKMTFIFGAEQILNKDSKALVTTNMNDTRVMIPMLKQSPISPYIGYIGSKAEAIKLNNKSYVLSSAKIEYLDNNNWNIILELKKDHDDSKPACVYTGSEK